MPSDDLNLRLLAAIIESSDDAIVSKTRDGIVTSWNPAAERIFGYSAAEMIGRPITTIIPADRMEEETTFLSRLARGERIDHYETVRVRKDGALVDVSVTVSPLRDDRGTLIGASKIARDITERKRQQAVMFQSEKLAALGRLVAGVAHEMNNPLGIISSRLEVMLLEAADDSLPASLVDDLQVLHRNSVRAARIAHSLLSFAPHAPRQHVPLDLNRVVDEALLLMERSLASAGIAVSTALDRSLPPILGDSAALHQVLVNLLTNVLEAMTDPGRVAIESRSADRPDHVRLVVADSGPGIDAPVLRNIFDPFFTTKEHGTGLGLSISYGIIREHGGTIEVESEPGRGTTFVLTFPQAP